MPNVLGRYEILDELGRGAMGVVYKARDPVLGRILAIKTMAADAVDDDELRRRLEREAAAAARLKHPNIITVHDYGEEDGVPFIAMEFLEGIDLKQILKNRIPLFPAEKIGILRQMALGLGHAHKEGVVHRDVKPANIRILRDGTVKIMDFGIARIASSNLTRVGTVLGSVDYMSPEQVEGKRVDRRADIFCFGVVAYEILTYRVPFKGDNMPATMRNILEAKMPPIDPAVLQGFPAIERIVRKCLARDPKDRFDNLEEVARELDAVRAEIGPEAEAKPISPGADSPANPYQETVVVRPGAASSTSDWQTGDSTISAAQLWADRERFEKIHDVIAKSEKSKPKRPVRSFGSNAAGSRPSQAASALTNRASRVGTRASQAGSAPPETSGRVGAPAIAIGAVLILLLGSGLWLMSRGSGGPDPSLEDFIERQLQSSSTKADTGDLRGAIADLERVIDVRPEHAETALRLEELRIAIRERYADAMARSRSAGASDDWASARAAAEEALTLLPGDTEAQQALSDAQAKLRGIEQRAETSERFEELLSEGRNHLEAGRTSEAITSLQAASALKPSSPEANQLLTEARRREDARREADSAYRSGVAALSQGELDVAVRALERATSLDPSHRQAKERLAEARRERERPRFGIVTVNALPFGVAFLDGESLGTTPVRLEQVPAGRHEVRIAKDGYQTYTRTIDVKEGETMNVVAQLEKNP